MARSRSPRRTSRGPRSRTARAAAADSATATIRLSVFDGTRSPIDPSVRLFVRILDGTQKQLHARDHKGPVIDFIVPFHDNFEDRYTVLVSAQGFHQAGFTPVPVRQDAVRSLDIMLVPKPYGFDFTGARWTALPSPLRSLFSAGAAPADARARYEAVLANRPRSLAALLNLVTAMQAILLPHGTPFDYLREIVWDASLAQDRFFAFADQALVQEVLDATDRGVFVPEVSPGLLHPGATRSFKQVQFGEANVQLTFHEGDTKTIDGTPCVEVEPDMDYYKDPLNHALLEVLPGFLGSITDPATVYVLRWIAGRFAGVPEFDPPYTLVPA
jgi:hypothetical protein